MTAGGAGGEGGTPGAGGDNNYCATYTVVSAPNPEATGNLGTLNGVCFRASSPVKQITNFAIYNCAGRTMTVNGQILTCPGNGACTGTFPIVPVGGYYYVDIGAGSSVDCSATWYCSADCN